MSTPADKIRADYDLIFFGGAREPGEGAPNPPFVCHEYYGDDRAGVMRWTWYADGRAAAASGLPR